MGYLILFLETIFIIAGIVILCFPRPCQIPASYTILLVKDSEVFIEGVVRSLLKAIKIKANLQSNHKILIIDLGSLDNTFGILERLSNTESCVEILCLPPLAEPR